MFYILGVMLSAGIVGGLAGHLAAAATVSANGSDAQVRPSLVADIIIGVVAAFCVPIFLQITQSKLMDALWTGVQGGTVPFLNLLYLGGFCLIAAFSSRTFLQSVSTQVLRQTVEKQKVLEAQQKVLGEGQEDLKDSVAEIGAEIDQPAPEIGAPSGRQTILPEITVADAAESEDELKETGDKLPDTDRRVLQALADERYTRRSMSGISKAALLSKSDTGASLEKLVAAGLVTEGTSKRTQSLLYQLTLKGRRLVSWMRNSG